MSNEPLTTADVREKAVPLNEREFDIVVYGVTGLCGAVVAEYFLSTYGSKIKIAYAGRSESKLQAARASLSALTKVPGADSIPLIIADSTDDESLHAMCKRTRVVATTVGPYAKYGEPLVRACALTGTGMANCKSAI
jgi:saccharopine dehydrogenase (NAD+, L-lysine-forming)